MLCFCRHYGDSYKWLLYGDDDTFYFLDAAINVLQHLDPDMPYFLTGDITHTDPARPFAFTTHLAATSLLQKSGALQEDAHGRPPPCPVLRFPQPNMQKITGIPGTALRVLHPRMYDGVGAHSIWGTSKGLQ